MDDWVVTKFIDRFFSYFIAIFFSLLAIGSVSLFIVDMSVTVAGEGTLRPRILSPVKSKVSGLIERIYVVDMESVSAADTLITIDVRSVRNDLRVTLSDISTARLVIDQKREEIRIQRNQLESDIQLRQAELTQSRFEEQQKRSLWQVDSVASNRSERPYDLKIVETQRAASEIRLLQVRDSADKMKLSELDLRLQETKLDALLKRKLYLESVIADSYVLSPASGVVFARDLQLKRGDYVSEGSAVLEIVVPGDWMMRTAVTDEAIPFIREGMRANIYLKAFPYISHNVFHGTVMAYSLDPIVVDGINVYTVDVQITNLELDRYLKGGYHLYGLRGSVRFIIDRKPVAHCLWEYFGKRASKVRFSSSTK